MGSPRQITLDAVNVISDAIFAEGPPTVAEAYSAFGQALQYFSDAGSIAKYAEAKARETNGVVHLALHYPDTAGRLSVKRIELDPSKCNGHRNRFACEGWGLIRVYLPVSPSPKLDSFISANSEKRAMAWSGTYPELDAPDTWNWAAVARHLRRLRRVLRKVA